MFRANSPVRRPFRTLNLEQLEDRTVLSTMTGDLSEALAARLGSFDPDSATWRLRSSSDAGAPDVGEFQYGAPGWLPVVGDWDGDGRATIGVVDPDTMTWYLRNSNTHGAPDIQPFAYGAAGWLPVVGDWDGDGRATIGVVDPDTMTWYLRDSNSAGAPDIEPFQYGAEDWVPLAGNWDGQGGTGIGVFDPEDATFRLRDAASAGAPDAGVFQYGAEDWVPVVGDWDDNGTATIGVVDPEAAEWYLRDSNSAGAPDAGQFQYGFSGWTALGNFTPTASPTDEPSEPSDPPDVEGDPLITLRLKPLDLNLLGLQVQTNEILVNVSARPGEGALLGNLISTVSNLINLEGVNNALNNVLDNVVTLVNSVDLNLDGADTSSGPFSSAPAEESTTILDLFVAPVHLDLLGVVVDTSPIRLTVTAHSGEGLVLGNVLTELTDLFNPPLPDSLDLAFINGRLEELLSDLETQLPGIPSAPTSPTPTGEGQVLNLSVPPIDLNLLGLILQTDEIRVNANAVTGDGRLLGNLTTVLLNTLDATQADLDALNANVNGLLAKVVGVLNASNLVLPDGAVESLDQVLQTLAVPDLINSSGSASVQVLDLTIATGDDSPPVDVDLLGLVVTTSDIDAQLRAQTGEGQVLGNLVYNVANLLNPGGSLNLLGILNALAL